MSDTRSRGKSAGKTVGGRRLPSARASKGTERGSWAASCIEGRRAATEALRAGVPVHRALLADGAETEGALSGLIGALERGGVPIARVPRAKLDALSSHGAHQGIVLETEPFPYATVEDVIARAGAGAALVVVLDHVTDEGNFGAIVRSAEVVGAAGVIIASKRAAAVGVGAYKTSAGAVMHLPIARVPNIVRALEALKGAGFWVGGATEHARDTVWDASLEGRIALVAGSEGSGLSRLVLESCDFTVRLPQRGQTESLNVAQAATVLCYEWLRRETASGEGTET
ncbi:RNA methyltransferase, TrmH family, group 3 [Coriobacterium glomerans PW2]|uniref:RNA methyltransferase, TrmH family, group 3 n=1 Tax=Coriobacterium glomerans (strain ATCC 49209 / DSM 20642 / JCM 10262 / PW2) TaxID=700015 RepID=F2NAM2_CORGP|nr:23S rRNA (guanosine(2251)-2'-O)-methyltransferase RlmB [Coriobacterium glomerans]AEB07478.1 RNA methyltransferase, TrmH family, group 3 [Coriobacterium glomerans PW2]